MKYTVVDMHGKIRGYVLEWRFGFLAYDETEFQLGNFASLLEAQNAVLNPPDILREFDAVMTISI